MQSLFSLFKIPGLSSTCNKISGLSRPGFFIFKIKDIQGFPRPVRTLDPAQHFSCSVKCGQLFLLGCPQGGHGRITILMDFHPYGYKTHVFTLSAPHEEAYGRQTKLHPGFTLGKLVQPPPGISILRDSHIVLSKRS